MSNYRISFKVFSGNNIGNFFSNSAHLFANAVTMLNFFFKTAIKFTTELVLTRQI